MDMISIADDYTKQIDQYIQNGESAYFCFEYFTDYIIDEIVSRDAKSLTSYNLLSNEETLTLEF